MSGTASVRPHRLRRIALWTAGMLLALPFVAVALVLIVLNTGPGRRLAERQAGALTGGQVAIAGLHGRFPDALRLDHLTVADAHGPWLTADGVVLDWSPFALLGRTARVRTAAIAHLTVARLPVAAAPAQPAQVSAGGFQLPVSVDVRDLRITRADIAAPVAGTAFAASLDATATAASLQDGQGTVTVTRLDSPGTYRADATLRPDSLAGHLTVREPPGGLIAALGKLPALGAINLTASLEGPKPAERAHLDLSAGALRATLSATADLPARSAVADLSATAPAMRPGPGVAWNGIDIKAHIAGPFTAPDASGHVTITGLTAGGANVQTIAADVSGTRGAAALHAALTGTRIPGGKPDLLAGSPVTLDAAINLAAADRPVRFTLSHALLRADGTARTAGPIAANVRLQVPDLAPLAEAGGANVQGSADLTANLTQSGTARHVTVAGPVTITGGQAPLPALIGPAALDVAATMDGSRLGIDHATLAGRKLRFDSAGAVQPAMDLSWHAALPDLSAVSPQAVGAITLAGSVSGPPDDLAASAHITGEAGTRQFAKGPVDLTLDAGNLPAAPTGTLLGTFRLRDSDVHLDAEATSEAGDARHVVLRHADWKSITTRADITVPKGGQAQGNVDFNAGNLADFSAFTGQALGGSLRAKLAAGQDDATVQVTGGNLAAGANHIASLLLNGRAAGLDADPDITGTLTLAGIDASGITGAAKVTASGHQAALLVSADADLTNVQGAPATVRTAALLNAKAKQVLLQKLTADWKSLALRLNGPARFDFGARTAVDRLALSVNQATVAVAGQLGPTLDLTARVSNVTPDLAHDFAPTLSAAGTLNADARLAGTTAAPRGTVHLAAAGLRLRTGPGAAIPAAGIRATVLLDGSTARLDAHIDAGPKLRLATSGTVPLQPQGALALRTNGTLDLTLFSPILQADGRNATGLARLDLAVSGTTAAPRVQGGVTLAGAGLQDYAQGLRLTNIQARIDATGDAFTISRFTAAAGPGTLSVTGSIGAMAPGMPVDLRITARNARPLSSDLLTALFDADLTVKGQAAGDMDATGKILLHRVEINIPDSVPPSVASLHVRRPGERPPPPPSAAPPSAIKLAITVDAPSNIFVRGKGLYAELGGRLTVAGTANAPQILGGFDLRRGDFALAGTTLTFSRGTVGFNGASATGKIDPTLDFEADSTTSSITATLKITGYADAPKIALSSVPDLPQDEILAHLLFGVSMKDLTPFQIAEIGAALAELSGATGSEGPLGSIRKGLGLDRLSVGGGGSGGGATVEGGRYVAKGVYVGAKQSAGGAGGTQAQVQIDITRHLKLNSTLGTGGGTAQGATPDNDPGSSIGLAYQFEY